MHVTYFPFVRFWTEVQQKNRTPNENNKFENIFRKQCKITSLTEDARILLQIHLTIRGEKKSSCCTMTNDREYIAWIEYSRYGKRRKKSNNESIRNKIVCQVKYAHYSNASNLWENLSKCFVARLMCIWAMCEAQEMR